MTENAASTLDRLDREMADWLVSDGERSHGSVARTHDLWPDDPRLAIRPVVVRLSDVGPQPIEWLAPSWLPKGKLVLLEGDPGVNKTVLALDIAARVTRGDAVFGSTPRDPRNVVLVTYEDGIADTVRPRIDVLGGDASRILAFRAIAIGDAGDERPPTFPNDVVHLDAIIREHEASLVIVDPLGAALSDATDSHKDASVRRVTAQLARLAEDTGACVLGIRHLVKGPATNALRAGGGSIAFIAAARVAMLVSVHPDDAEKPQHARRRVLACVKNNLAPYPPSRVFELWQPDGAEHPRIQWLGDSPLSADDLNAAHASDAPEERDSTTERAGWLRELLSEGPLDSREVFKLGRKVGFNERSVRRTARAMGVLIRRAGSGTKHRSMWEAVTPVTAATPASDERASGVTGVASGIDEGGASTPAKGTEAC
jgi:hypothetical protein